MKRSTRYYKGMILLIIFHTFLTIYACGKEEFKIPTIKEIFDEDKIFDKTRYKEIMEDNRKNNLDKYLQDIAILYDLKETYSNAVRNLVKIKMNLTKGKSDQISLMIKRDGLVNMLKSLEDGLKLFDKNREELERILQTEDPPAYFVHKTAYIKAELDSDPKYIFNSLTGYLRGSTETYYGDFINVDKTTTKVLQQEYLKSIRSNYATLLEHVELVAPYCEQIDSDLSQKGMVYFVSEIYAVEAGRASKSQEDGVKSTENFKGLDIKTFEVTENLKKSFGINFCEEKDKSRLTDFMGRVKTQNEKTREMQSSQEKLWSSFWGSKNEIINRIAKNMEEKRKITTDIFSVKKGIKEIDEKIRNLENEEEKTRAKGDKLKKEIKEFQSNYLSALADRKLDIVVEGRGEHKLQALSNLLKEGEKMSNIQFRKITMELFGSSSVKEKKWTMNIKNKLIDYNMLGWYRDGVEFVAAAKLTYRVNILKELIPIRDFEANVTAEFIERTKGDVGDIQKELLTKDEWWHIGFSDAGHTYDEAKNFFSDNGGNWSLPSIDDMNSIRSQEPGQISIITGVQDDTPYWTSDIAKNGNPYGYCFGSNGNCSKIFSGHSRDYPKSDGLALILIRKYRIEVSVKPPNILKRTPGIEIKCQEKYERIGGNYDILELLFFDKNDILVFRGSLQAVEFVPENAYCFRLNDPENKFVFIKETIGPLSEKIKIDFNTFGKSTDVLVKLRPEKPEMPIPEQAYKNVRFLDSKSNPILFQTDSDKTFKGNVLFSYSIREDNKISSYPKIIKKCCPGYREQIIELKPTEPSSLSPLVIEVQMQLLLPDVVVIISGNISSNRREYYAWSRDAIIDIWDTYSQQMQVGVANEGKVDMMRDREELMKCGPSMEATNFRVNEEIIEAQQYFKRTKDGCGNSPPQRLVYIGIEPGDVEHNSTGTSPIYIISSERKPFGWLWEWFMAPSKNSIKEALIKILGGN